MKILKTQLPFALFILLVLCATGFAGWIFFEIFVIDPPSANIKFSNQLNLLGKDLKAYKERTGLYPKTLVDFQGSDVLCIKQTFTHCGDIKYKPALDLKHFTMAMKGLGRKIIFYEPGVSFTLEEFPKLPKEEQEKIRSQGRICFGCIAFSEWWGDKFNNNLVYRVDPRYFPDPDEWPKLSM